MIQAYYQLALTFKLPPPFLLLMLCHMVCGFLPHLFTCVASSVAGWHLSDSALRFISAWISRLVLSCLFRGQRSFTYQPVRATHVHSVQKDHPTAP